MPIGGTTGGMAGGSGVGGSGGAQGAQGTQGHQGAQGGGSVAGASIVRKFPFAFDTPGILTGAALYTPTIGDILLDAWFEIDTAWDGTTPLGDFGPFVGGNLGWFGGWNSPVEMVDADNATSVWGANLLTQISGGSSRGKPSGLTWAYLAGVGNTSPASAYVRALPAKFTTADPIKVCVSQDGTNNGADPGSTVGAAVLYLVTATPA